MTIIAFTKVKLPYGWLGNMSPYPIKYQGRTWRTTEALFQAMRFNDNEIKEEIREQKSPMAAKMKAKKHKDKMVITPCSVYDRENMKTCLNLKVEQHDEIRQQLINTKNAKIIEDCTSRGRRGSNLLWGSINVDGEWEGANVLGRMWMEIRCEERIKSIVESHDPLFAGITTYTYPNDRNTAILQVHYGSGRPGTSDREKEFNLADDNIEEIIAQWIDNVSWELDQICDPD